MRGAMKHWRHETFAPPGPPAPRPWPYMRAREMRLAARVGLALVAAVCLAIAIGAHTLLAPPQPVDRAVVEPTGANRMITGPR